jgi:Smr domain
VQIDLHGYRLSEIGRNGLLLKIVQQCWEMGETELRLIHGHGRARGKSPGFVNTNTGVLGLTIRSILRNKRKLRQWVKYTTLDCRQWGVTKVKLKSNPAPSRTSLDPDLLEDRRHLAHADWHERDVSPPNGAPAGIEGAASARNE